MKTKNNSQGLNSKILRTVEAQLKIPRTYIKKLSVWVCFGFCFGATKTEVIDYHTDEDKISIDKSFSEAFGLGRIFSVRFWFFLESKIRSN